MSEDMIEILYDLICIAPWLKLNLKRDNNGAKKKEKEQKNTYVIKKR